MKFGLSCHGIDHVTQTFFWRTVGLLIKGMELFVRPSTKWHGEQMLGKPVDLLLRTVTSLTRDELAERMTVEASLVVFEHTSN